jgi:hypothetical protein
MRPPVVSSLTAVVYYRAIRLEPKATLNRLLTFALFAPIRVFRDPNAYRAAGVRVGDGVLVSVGVAVSVAVNVGRGVEGGSVG